MASTHPKQFQGALKVLQAKAPTLLVDLTAGDNPGWDAEVGSDVFPGLSWWDHKHS